MAKLLRAPPAGSLDPEKRMPGGIVFLVLILVSIILWAVLIAFIV